MRGQAAGEKIEWKGSKGRAGVHGGRTPDHSRLSWDLTGLECKPLLPAVMRMAGSVGAPWRQGKMISPSQDPVLGYLGRGEQIKKAEKVGGKNKERQHCDHLHHILF